MRISSFSTVRPQMSSTRTYEDFYKFLGEKPARLGIVSSLYEQYTASYLTESLMNIYTMEKDKKNSFQSINSFMVEWDINVGFIKRIPFLQVPDGDGAQGTDIIFHFPENYYQRNDVMIIEGSRQQEQLQKTLFDQASSISLYIPGKYSLFLSIKCFEHCSERDTKIAKYLIDISIGRERT